jgi:hypothetical protein
LPHVAAVSAKRYFTFIVASGRRDGNTEWLTRKAAERLPAGAAQQWLHLSDLPLPPFEDIRHLRRLLSSTLELLQAADRFDPLPIRVLEEGGEIVIGEVFPDGRRAVIFATGFDALAMEGLDGLP